MYLHEIQPGTKEAEEVAILLWKNLLEVAAYERGEIIDHLTITSKRTGKVVYEKDYRNGR